MFKMIFLETVCKGIGAVGMAVVVWGVLKGAFLFLRAEIVGLSGRGSSEIPLDKIRFELGRYLLLGLEFLIAADIMLTIADPGLEDVAVLGVIVIIRTVLSYFLTREMTHAGR